MSRKKKNKYSTKQDNVPHDDEERKRMIEEFISQNAEDGECFQCYEAIPYEGAQMVRSTVRGKGKRSE
tara:strand:+ start:3277 stop:3480 length:204 start_codon:yes stop_codon:yes gene_type:complete